MALSECGTHAILAAEVDAYTVGEKTLANRLYPRLNPDELLTADRNFYSFGAWALAADTGAALLWRAPTQLGLPVVKVLPDGTYLSVLINPKIRNTARRDQILAAATEGENLDPQEAHLVRVVEYDVPGRTGNGAGELIVLLSTITDPGRLAASTEARPSRLNRRWPLDIRSQNLAAAAAGRARMGLRRPLSRWM